MAAPRFKDMIVDTNANDIVYTAAISGVHGNFLRPSIDAAGATDIDLAATTKQLDLNHEKRAWKNVWSAGQGVGSIDDVPTHGGTVRAARARIPRSDERSGFGDGPIAGRLSAAQRFGCRSTRNASR